VFTHFCKGDRDKDAFKFIDPSFHGTLLMILMISSILPSYTARSMPKSFYTIISDVFNDSEGN